MEKKEQEKIKEENKIQEGIKKENKIQEGIKKKEKKHDTVDKLNIVKIKIIYNDFAQSTQTVT